MSEENEKKSVSDEVTEKIKEILFSGELERGQKLPSENKLAERIGVGRSSVREALKQLSAFGYIELVPNRGAFASVTSSDELPSPKDGAINWLSVNRSSVDELLKSRAFIEPLAAELCAANADNALITALSDNIEEFSRELDNEHFDKLSELDYEFHRMILDGSGNRFIIGMYSQLLQLFMQYSRSSFRATGSKKYTLTEHWIILDAIKAGSPEEAKLAMSLHLKIAMRRMNELNKSNQSMDDNKE